MDEENLFPEEDELEEDDLVDDDDSEEPIGYKIAPYFDSFLGDFLLNGNGQVITADEVTAWRQWCENILATDRYNHDAYTDDIGIDYDEIFKLNDPDEIETELEAEISEALACDPYGRTLYVQNVEFEWVSSTELIVRTEVVGLDNELVTIDTVINA